MYHGDLDTDCFVGTLEPPGLDKMTPLRLGALNVTLSNQTVLQGAAIIQYGKTEAPPATPTAKCTTFPLVSWVPWCCATSTRSGRERPTEAKPSITQSRCPLTVLRGNSICPCLTRSLLWTFLTFACTNTLDTPSVQLCSLQHGTTLTKTRWSPRHWLTKQAKPHRDGEGADCLFPHCHGRDWYFEVRWHVRRRMESQPHEVGNDVRLYQICDSAGIALCVGPSNSDSVVTRRREQLSAQLGDWYHQCLGLWHGSVLVPLLGCKIRLPKKARGKVKP